MFNSVWYWVEEMDFTSAEISVYVSAVTVIVYVVQLCLSDSDPSYI